MFLRYLQVASLAILRNDLSVRLDRNETDTPIGSAWAPPSAALKSFPINTRIKTMTNKSNFTPDEWKLILSSPMLAGMAVTLADPSGLWA